MRLLEHQRLKHIQQPSWGMQVFLMKRAFRASCANARQHTTDSSEINGFASSLMVIQTGRSLTEETCRKYEVITPQLPPLMGVGSDTATLPHVRVVFHDHPR